MRYLFFLALCASFTIKGQDVMINMTNLQGNMVRLEDRYSDIEGSPYLPKDFKEGYVKIGKQTLYGVFMRFNMYNQRIELERENGDVIELDTRGIYEIGMDRQRPNVYQMKFTQLEEGWYQELVPGLIYKVHKVKMQEAQPEFNSAKLDKKFVDVSTYYLRKGKELKSFALRRRDILDLVSDEEAVKSYVKGNKLKWNSEDDVIQILKMAFGKE